MEAQIKDLKEQLKKLAVQLKQKKHDEEVAEAERNKNIDMLQACLTPRPVTER